MRLVEQRASKITEGAGFRYAGLYSLQTFTVSGKDLHVTKNIFKYRLVFGILFGICVPARVLAFHGQPTPEIDPSLAISAITLLAGSLVILRIRRNK
jgi:hypothetical protein